jgi:hypothetical protein
MDFYLWHGKMKNNLQNYLALALGSVSEFNRLKLSFDYIASKTTNTAAPSWLQKYLQAALATVITLSLLLVDIHLSKHFIVTKITYNVYVAMILATIAAFPGVIATFLSVYRLAAKLFKGKANQPNRLFRQVFPRLYPWLANILIIIALTAPTATAHIVYSTLTQEGFHHIIVFSAVMALTLARIIFSYFTLTQLLQEGLLWLLKQKVIYNKEALKYLYLKQLQLGMESL